MKLEWRKSGQSIMGGRGQLSFYKVYPHERTGRFALSSYLIGAINSASADTADELKALAEADFGEWLKRCGLEDRS